MKENILMEERARKILRYAFFITLFFFFVELIGGYISKSLALITDSFHMLLDVSAIGIAYFATKLAGRKRNLMKTFGYHRFEIISALFNGLMLLGISFFMLSRAYGRILNSQKVLTDIMIPIAFLGLMVNIIVGLILYKGKKENLNIKGAYLHVLGDTLSSTGVVAGGILMGLTGFYLIDPIISIFVAFLILIETLHFIKEPIEILTESAPKEIDVKKLIDSLQSIPGVKKIHDFHIWSIKTGAVNVTSHLLVEENVNPSEILASASKVLREKFNITHFTFQIESELNKGCCHCEEISSESH